MSDSEHSQPHDGSDEDIYNDFAEFNFENEVAKLESSKEVYKQEAHDLSERVKKLTEENEELKKLNETLKKNLSTLLKTAQAEVQRKDLVISELRSKIDAFTFKRNKNPSNVKDKFTNTENWSNSCNCGNVPEEKKTDSFNSRFKNERKSKSSQEKESRRETSSGRNESPVCDNNRKLGYEDKTKYSFKNSDSNNESYSDRPRGSHSYRHREKEYFESKRSFRYNHRDHLKYDSMDKKRHPDEKYSFRFRDSKDRRREWRGGSPIRHRRDYKRERSHSREHSSKSRNSSEFRSSREEIGIKGKEREDHKFRNSELENFKTESRRRSRNRGDSTERGERSQQESNTSSDDQKKNFRKSLESNLFETKSPLDSLYSEPVVSRGFSQSLAPKDEAFTEVKRSEPRTEEDTHVEEQFEELQTEDWMLSFKNERQNDTKPMTLYSKRMMQKLVCSENQRLKNEEAPKENSSKGNQKPSSVEKEPGELTDDENIVESSKEFQELTQLASIESKAIVEMGKYDESKKTDTELFKEPIKVSNEKNAQKENSESDRAPEEESVFQKGTGDVIEFSPFKNNYKLIEISLTKPQETRKEQLRNLSSGTQKEVESSIFDLLTSMSGVPIDRKPNETKIKKVQDEAETKKVEGSGAKNNKCKEKEVRPEGRSTRSKTPKPKKNKVETKKGKHEIDQKEKSPSPDEKKDEPKLVDEVTPGETTQFLDFFLLTTSPSKPIMPREVEKALGEVQKESSFEESPISAKVDGEEEKGKPKSEEGINTSLEIKAENETKKEDEVKKSPKPKKRVPLKTISKPMKEDKSKKRKRKESEEEFETKKLKRKESKEESETKKLKRKESEEESETEKQKRKESEELEIKKQKRKEGEEESEIKKQKRKEGEEESEIKKQKRKENEEESEIKKQKRKESEEEPETKKRKIEKPKSPRRRTRSERDSKNESQPASSSEKTNENISLFEFFKPVAKTESTKEDKVENTSADYKITTTMSVTGVVCLETPSKCVEKLKNVNVNEQTVHQVVDSKSVPFSPLVGSKYVEMTPRRMLKNDLMLTDSEDDSIMKSNQKIEKSRNNEKTDDEEEGESYESENSERDSDSGASDLVDLL